ncbi:uncharacterized protein ACJ7VT_021825 [Polymixia lowei]
MLQTGNSNYDKSDFKVLFVLDGLDESRLQLDFTGNKECSVDITKSASVDVLLSNLIRGKLLPSAHVWITTRPAAASESLLECVDMVTCKHGNMKFHGRAWTDQPWNTENKEIILSLGKLAFEQLEKGNPFFYEADLEDCGINIKAASVDTGVNLLRETQPTTWMSKLTLKKVKPFYQNAVARALHSEKGHLDLFLRFLLGLSVESNQTLLRGLLKQTGSSNLSVQTNQETIQYIKRKIRENPSAERSINLFHCLNELKDHSLVEEIQQSLTSGSLSTDKLSPAQWSALVFILLSSEEKLDVFELKKYSASDEGLLRLLPVVKASNVSLLNDCGLSERCCEEIESKQALRDMLLDDCELSETACKTLASVLSSKSSRLRELDLSNNDLLDSGVKLLSAGLGSPHCRLETLRLSGCVLTEEGCASLASALSPSHLRELDLSYNHPGDSGVKLLSAGLEDPQWTLSLDHCGKCRLHPVPLRYACELTLDPNTVNRNLLLSEENRKVTEVEEKQSYPDHPERFHYCKQVLCREGLTGRCYWEVERSGWVHIGVTYRGINRKGKGCDSSLGGNDKSLSLFCSNNSYSAWHNQKRTVIRLPSSSGSNRVGVYLDWPAGTLSFFTVSSDTLTHIHTFHSTFTEPLYPAFWFGFWAGPGSSVTLCQIEEVDEPPSS